MIVDPSAASFIAELQRRGLPVLRADNRVADGIRAVDELLRTGQLLIGTACTHTVEEFQSYVWDESAAQHGEDRPRKENDHCMDALRYFVTAVPMRAGARVTGRPRGL